MPKAHSSHLYLKAACQACLSMTACPSQGYLPVATCPKSRLLSKAIIQGSCQVKAACQACLSMTACPSQGYLPVATCPKSRLLSKAIIQGSCQVKVVVNDHMSKAV